MSEKTPESGVSAPRPPAGERKKRRKRKRAFRRALTRFFRALIVILLGAAALALLLALSPLLVLLSLIPARLRVVCEENAVSGEIQYVFLRFPLSGKVPSEPPKPPESAEQRKKTSAGKGKKEKQPLSERLSLVRPMIEAGWVALRRLLRHVRVRQLDVCVRVAAEDPADAALLYGRLYAAAGVAYSLLGSGGRLGRFHFEASPDFNATCTVCNGRACASVRPVWLFCALLCGGSKLLTALIRQKMSNPPPGLNAPDANPNAAPTGGADPDLFRKGGKTMSHPIENLMGTSMQKIREMVDVNTMIGDPIHITDKITVIPISRASFGFASGGSDIPSKQAKDLFGGGAGAGVKIDPVAFIVVNGDDVQLLPYAPAPAPGADRAISMVPGLIEQISGLFKKKTDEKPDDAENAPAE